MNESLDTKQLTRSERNPDRAPTREARGKLKDTMASLKQSENPRKTSATQYFALEFLRLHEEFRDRGDLGTNPSTERDYTARLDEIYAQMFRFPKARRALLREVGLDKNTHRPVTFLERLRRRVYGTDDSVVLFTPRHS